MQRGSCGMLLAIVACGSGAAHHAAGDGAGSMSASGDSGIAGTGGSAAVGGVRTDGGAAEVPLAPLTRVPRLLTDATELCGPGARQPAMPEDAGTGACSDPDARDVSARGTASGSNGEFTDECNANGDVTEYMCEFQYTSMPGCYIPGGAGAVPGGGGSPAGDATPECPSSPTGRVVGSVVPCFGLCRDGACGTFCPVTGDSIRYEQVDSDGSATLVNACDGGRYHCTLLEDHATAFDCIGSPTVGFVTTIAVAYRFGGADGCTGMWPGSTIPSMASPGSRHVEIQTRDEDVVGLQIACTYSCLIIE